jgi:glycosyltransferase involved in cell wall biosynthesis
MKWAWLRVPVAHFPNLALNIGKTHIYNRSNNDCFLCSQFQGLFNPLFWVLFTFPTRYLYAIGLRVVFSFRRKIPPILRLHSKAVRLWIGVFYIHKVVIRIQGFHLLWRAFPGDLSYWLKYVQKIYLMLANIFLLDISPSDIVLSYTEWALQVAKGPFATIIIFFFIFYLPSRRGGNSGPTKPQISVYDFHISSVELVNFNAWAFSYQNGGTFIILEPQYR